MLCIIIAIRIARLPLSLSLIFHVAPKIILSNNLKPQILKPSIPANFSLRPPMHLCNNTLAPSLCKVFCSFLLKLICLIS